jgi:hypothetical protein
MAYSPSSRSNSEIERSQISFGTIIFQPHPPLLILVFANFNRELNLTFESLNFCVGSQGSLRLYDPIYSGPSADKTAAVATSECSVGSSSEANSLVSLKPAESKGDLSDLLNEISYKLDFADISDLP